ncbi:hypothetical protein GCM10011409_18750 [Lentibacillus populi]|uniref:Uncharacterized protein n=1 Tax=Lentibacillus populi TaxID=1827502 RepID=A0A9W5X574_9BACI|nr:hypothetical protein [Lentibacillus populi]GGB41467.1 hypothetical protein GCM10011409_18750 [Lentibacillus populi]
MNTLNGRDPILPREKSKLLFDNKDIDFGFPEWQLEEVLRLWRNGKSVYYISRWTKRNEHEVFLSLYEFWIEGVIDDIEKAFSAGNTLLVPGKQQLIKTQQRKENKNGLFKTSKKRNPKRMV